MPVIIPVLDNMLENYHGKVKNITEDLNVIEKA